MECRIRPKRVIGDAYLYAEGDSPITPEIQNASYVEKFGVEAVFGRPVLSAGEIRRMVAAENVLAAHRSRAQSDDWSKWAHENKSAAELLGLAAKVANG